MKLLKLSVFLLVASWSFFARAQTQTLVIRAGTMLDGAGHTLHNVMIVVEGGKIVRVEQNAKDQKLPGASAYDLTHNDGDAGMDRPARSHHLGILVRTDV
jgi:hypothetical protein